MLLLRVQWRKPGGVREYRDLGVWAWKMMPVALCNGVWGWVVQL